jgi:MoxR-like ATPase
MQIEQLNRDIEKENQFVKSVLQEVSKVIVGQKEMVESILMGLLTGGHVLLEGLPGLAKTLTIATVARATSLGFQRIQFTPDLLPSDLVGTMIFNQKTNEFTAKKGPIFTNIVLADEINRAPAKVQSALLEAMGEKQVTIGETTYQLDSPFLVLATQNPIEQEGTYPLPEAQMDRFMFKTVVKYPNRQEEMSILESLSTDSAPAVSSMINKEDILRVRKLINQVYIDSKIKNYIVEIIFATRNPSEMGLRKLESLIQVGGSPRATLSLARASRAYAFLKGRGYVTADDIKAIAYLVMRHRILLTYEAEAEDITSDEVISEVLNHVEVP